MVHHKHFFSAAFILAVMLSSGSTPAQTPAPHAAQSPLLGDWRGDSICVARQGACHDEKALYHVAEVPGKSDRLAITFSKIVDDRPVRMGTLECAYDQNKNTATCEYPVGVWALEFKGNQMNGTLTLSDKTLLRRVKLKKEA
jgi:hypothetical protein